MRAGRLEHVGAGRCCGCGGRGDWTLRREKLVMARATGVGRRDCHRALVLWILDSSRLGFCLLKMGSSGMSRQVP